MIPSRSVADAAAFAAPAVFVLFWASGFIGAKLGLPYAEPMTFLTIRMGLVVVLLGLIVLVTRPRWPAPADALHSAVVGLRSPTCCWASASRRGNGSASASASSASIWSCMAAPRARRR
jgi:drug/metabolite transporter (DMT)-like permease